LEFSTCAWYTSEKGFIEDKITIETDVEREEKLILPVTAHIKE
jgi:hypothetical protein